MKSWIRRLAIGLALVVPGASFAAQAMKVMFDDTPVMASPGGGAQLGTSPRYHSYVSLAVQNGWHQVWFDHRHGWIHESKLSADPRPVLAVTASAANVRTGPGLDWRVAGTAPQGSQWLAIADTGPNKDWKQLYHGGDIRYMHTSVFQAQRPDLPKSEAGFVQLPPSGEGFYAIAGRDRVWGVPRLVYPLIELSRKMKRDHPDWGRLGINDISMRNGGWMSGHVSHQKGVDVDLRLMRNDQVEVTTDIYKTTYSRARTRALITDYLHRDLDINVVLFGDPQVYGRVTSNREAECAKAPVSSALGYVACWPNHHHHLHVRVN